MSPAGLEPARSKAWGLKSHSLDQLGHGDVYGNVQDRMDDYTVTRTVVPHRWNRTRPF